MSEQIPETLILDVEPITPNQLTFVDKLRDTIRNVANQIAAPAAAVALTGLLAACGSAKEAPAAAVSPTSSTPTPESSTSNPAPTTAKSTVRPSNLPTASETAPTFDQETIDAYKKLPIEQFNQLPRETRLMVVWDMYCNVENKGQLVEFMPQTMHDGRFLYQENPARDGNQPMATDDGQKMLMQQNFGEAVAAAYKQDLTETGNGAMDFNGAQQMLSGFIYNVGKADTSGVYNQNIAHLEVIMKQNSGQAVELPKLEQMLALETGQAKTETDSDGKQITTKSYVYNVGDGNTYRDTAVLQSFLDKNGQEQSLWLIRDETKVTYSDQVSAAK